MISVILARSGGPPAAASIASATLDVKIEVMVEKTPGDLLGRRELGDPGVGEENVEPSEFLRDDLHQGVCIDEIVCVRRNYQGTGAQRRLHIFNRFWIVACGDHLRALVLKQCAVAKPIPVVPPVTIATPSSSLPIEIPPEGCGPRLPT
jgi:hypothetical protein